MLTHNFSGLPQDLRAAAGHPLAIRRLQMGALLVILPLILVAAPAHVKAGDARHLRASEGQEVFVIDSDQREWRGKLLEVATASVTIDQQTGPKRFPLDDIRRVDADGDRIRDGLLKG